MLNFLSWLLSGDRRPRSGRRSVSRPIVSSCSCSSPPSRSPSANQRCRIHCALITPPCMPCRTSNPGPRTGNRDQNTRLQSISTIYDPWEDESIQLGLHEDSGTYFDPYNGEEINKCWTRLTEEWATATGVDGCEAGPEMMVSE